MRPISAIIHRQIERIAAISDERQLTEEEWRLLEHIAVLDFRLTHRPMHASQEMMLTPEEEDDLVEALTPKKDPLLFPRRGPNRTSKVHDE